MMGDWLWIMLVVIGAWLIISAFQRLMKLLVKIADRLTAIQNTQTMLFYTVEQIFEMSELPKRFMSEKPAEAGAVLQPEPAVNVEDAESIQTWSTLMQRVQNRVESVVRLQYRLQANDRAEEADGMMIQDQQRGWVNRMPMLRGWPLHPHICWWGTEEKRPEGVPLFNRQDD